MLVDLVKNNISTSKNYGQYYGRVFQREALSLKGFARHMMEHGKRITYEELVLTLQQTVSCLKELAIQGVPVKLEGLGTFYPSLEGIGADSIQEYDPLLNIKGVHLNFRPEGSGTDDERLTGSVYVQDERLRDSSLQDGGRQEEGVVRASPHRHPGHQGC